MNRIKPFENRVKRLLKDGKKTSGAWLQIASPITAEIISSAGFDWVIVDMEHGPGDILTLIDQLQAMKGSEVGSLVRVPWNDFVVIKRVLDAGAHGVLIPYVNTKAAAEAAVRACKYPPEGIRGIAGSVRAARFNQNSLENYFNRANDEILVVTQVETAEAVANLDEILEVPGLDGIFIGPMDLSTSMGHLGKMGHPDVQSAIATVEAKALKANKILGTVSANWDQAKQLYDRGYQMITLMADGVGLANLAADTVANFQKAFPEG